MRFGRPEGLRYSPHVHVLLLSTYELGRQPFGLASPAAWLRQAGFEVTVEDLSRSRLDEDAVRRAGIIALFLPMHTATRLALPVIAKLRALNPEAHLCAYGLYAPVNEPLLRSRGVTTILGVEFEADLVSLAEAIASGAAGLELEPGGPRASRLPRLRFRVPDRSGLPPLDRYATLCWPNGSTRIAGYTEASRGCKHRCRHCPVVPVYDGRFRIVDADVVIEDARAQIAAGATHITFGDPDFFNGIGHARRVVTAFAAVCPGISYDVTIKIEHLLTHAADLPLLRDSGCAFVTSAVESVDDRVLARLEKGHTAADFERVAALMDSVGLPLVPTFVPFTPWTTLEGYVEMLDAVERLGLVAHVAPIQWAIRLLIPAGSRLLELPDVQARIDDFDPAGLAFPWRHEDRRVDALQRRVAALVGRQQAVGRADVFEAIRAMAVSMCEDASVVRARALPPPIARASVPYLTEPWYC
jgi:radical SAM superfamily enzyme YgiQ (UPF0313 family)